MKYTLLELVQTIASSMDSDEVNSIADSVESQQIATCVRTAYFDLTSRLNLPEHNTLFNLEPSGDATKPVVMYVPDSIEKVEWVKYNIETLTDTDENYVTIPFLPLEEFLKRMYMLKESDTNVGTFAHTVDSSSINFLYTDDFAPRYYTSFDDRTLIFDGYDSDVDSTLQLSKSLGRGRKSITWTNSDIFIPNLDETQFPLLLQEAKALAWSELKQMAHPRAERTVRQHLVEAQKTKHRTETASDLSQLPSFGRK